MYCVYVTTYLGDRLPRFYVGSSSLHKVINEKYRGSVSSKEWKNIWTEELNNNPHLFETSVIGTYDTRQEALQAELDFQIKENVVNSPDWINKSLAQPNGFFGMDVTGANNPKFGSNRTGEKHKGGENISKALQEFFSSDASANHRTSSRDRLKQNNPTFNPEIMSKIKETWKKAILF